MIHVVVFNPSWHTMGGGEKYLLVLADTLARVPGVNVRLLGEEEGPDLEHLRSYFCVDLHGVEMEPCCSHELRKRLAAADVAVIESNFRGFGHPAARTVYILQVPYGSLSCRAIVSMAAGGAWRNAAKDVLRRRLLADARKADLTIANSQFTSDALRIHHGLPTEILCPPIDLYRPAEKKPIILSVGRFFRGAYNQKRFEELIRAFRMLSLSLPAPSGWQFHIAGSVDPSPAASEYLAFLKSEADGLPVYFHPNASYAELEQLYGAASIFWHAAGLGVDEQQHPEQVEHFGMTTAEAMSAGCVPVVISKGGQREIVSHGESGYLWNTIEELLAFSTTLITSPDILVSIGSNARARSQDYSRERFSERCLTLFERLGITAHG